MNNLLREILVTWRTLRRRPGLTLAAVLTLAIAIGANAVVFSVTNGILLKPLPFAEPDRLVMLWETNPNLHLGFDDLPVSPGDYSSWSAESHSIEAMAAVGAGTATLTGVGDPVRIGGASVSSNFFDVLGVAPDIGRGFAGADGSDGAEHVVVLGHALWTDRFAASRSVLGRVVTLDGDTYRVVGVMPPGFAYPAATDLPSYTGAADRCDYWRPVHIGDDRANRQLAVLGRLAPGTSIARAQAEMDVISARLAAAFPGTDDGFGVKVRALDEQIVGSVRPALLFLEGAVVVVLLIACANLANLMLVRASSRTREIAVRAALGASRFRLLRQQVVESLVLALLGGAAGVVVAYWGLQGARLLAPRNVPRLDAIALDGWVLGFTLVVSVATGLAFGILPALRSSRVNVQSALRDAGHRVSSGHGRTRFGIVAAQIAVLTVLLAATGLAVHSFVRLLGVPTGFRPDGVLAATASLSSTKYPDPARAAAFFDEAIDAIGAEPGVESAAVVSQLPLSGSVYAGGFSVRERPDLDSEDGLVADRRIVSSRYFETLRIPVLAGRPFAGADRADAPGVAIVSESFRRRYLGDGISIGMHVKLGGPDSSRPWLEVVGIAGDVRDAALERDPTPHIYVPFDQMPFSTMTLVVRGSGEPADLVPSVRRVVARMDADQALTDVRSLDAFVDDALVAPRFAVALLGCFAMVALALGCVGLFGVVANSVAGRTREIGVRMALGARPEDAVRLVLGEGLRVVAVGIVGGLAMSFGVTRLLRSLLFEVSPSDPLTFAAVPALLAAVALVACYVPARRASRVDPTVALRSE